MTRLTEVQLWPMLRSLRALEQALARAEASCARSDALKELARPITPGMPRTSL